MSAHTVVEVAPDNTLSFTITSPQKSDIWLKEGMVIGRIHQLDKTTTHTLCTIAGKQISTKSSTEVDKVKPTSTATY